MSILCVIFPETSQGTADSDDNSQVKISTLTNALAALRIEKTHSEQAFHADKKRLLQVRNKLSTSFVTDSVRFLIG